MLPYNELRRRVFHRLSSRTEQRQMRRRSTAAASGSPADGNNGRHYMIRMLELIPAAAQFTTGHKYPERKNPRRPQRTADSQNYRRPSALRGTSRSRSRGSLLQFSFGQRDFKLTFVGIVYHFNRSAKKTGEKKKRGYRWVDIFPPPKARGWNLLSDNVCTK